MYYVESEFSFDSAHFLKGHPGRCRFIHGHRWRVVVTLQSQYLKDGMVIDFKDLKGKLKEVENNFDHTLIIEKDSVSKEFLQVFVKEGFRYLEVPDRPTAENMAKYFYGVFEKMFNWNSINRVVVYETPNNKAIYKEDNNE